MLEFFKRLGFGSQDDIRLIQPDDDPDAARIRQALQAGDWNSATSFYENLSLRDREFYTHALGDWPGRPEFFDRWVNEQPQCPVPLLLRGYHSFKWAWEARTGAMAEDVSRSQADLFHERLWAAQADLQRSRELRGDDANCHWGLLAVGVGLSIPRSDAVVLFEDGIRHDPEHTGLHRSMARLLCKKWHGSHKEMFEFARQVSAAAPDGSLTQLVIPYAHTERWLYRAVFEDDAAADDYWDSGSVRREIIEAYERGIGSPAHQPSRLTREISNDFAFCFGCLQDRERLAVTLRSIDNRPTEFPWSFKSADPARSFRKVKRWAGVE